ncbi:MAG TPA: hypothetical protein VG407_19125, partial [Caulobacteraceae bacterium]|nr:hypothetical protein [Caulobacteraceae bacterium]
HDLPGGHAGWVHKSMLGDVRAIHGSMMYAAPSDRGKYIYKFDDETDVVAMGCQGPFVKIQYKGTVGWSNMICSNDRTTCV